MTDLLLRVCGLNLTVGGLVLALLAVRRLLARRYTARWRCWVWLVLAIRLLLPFSLGPADWLPVQLELPRQLAEPNYAPPAWQGADSQPQTEQNELENRTNEPETSQEQASAPSIQVGSPVLLPKTARRPSLLQFAAWVWLGGAAVCMAAQLLRYGLWRRVVLRWNNPAKQPELLRLLRNESRAAGLRASPPVFWNPKISSPLVVGYWRPILLLPEAFDMGKAAGPVLRHECIHIRRHDLLKKLLLLAAAALNWFNPLAWLLRDMGAQDIELACDEAVLAGQGGARRILYGHTLVKLADKTEDAPAEFRL